MVVMSGSRFPGVVAVVSRRQGLDRQEVVEREQIADLRARIEELSGRLTGHQAVLCVGEAGLAVLGLVYQLPGTVG